MDECPNDRFALSHRREVSGTDFLDGDPTRGERRGRLEARVALQQIVGGHFQNLIRKRVKVDLEKAKARRQGPTALSPEARLPGAEFLEGAAQGEQLPPSWSLKF